MDSPNRLSNRIWMGQYGFGPNSVLAQAKRTYLAGRRSIAADDYFITYASILYSVMNDPVAWTKRLPNGPIAAVRLWWLLHWSLGQWKDQYSSTNYTAAQCETLASILLFFLRHVPLMRRVRAAFKIWVRDLLTDGLNKAMGDCAAHTKTLLLVHQARLLLLKHQATTTASRIEGNTPALSGFRHALNIAASYVPDVEVPNQQARCYRAIAEAYDDAFLGGLATDYFNLAERVRNIDDSVRRKTHAARVRRSL